MIGVVKITSSVTGKSIFIPKYLIGAICDITSVHSDLAQSEVLSLSGYSFKAIEPAEKLAEEIWGL